MSDLPGRLYRATRFPPLVPAGGGRDVRTTRLHQFLNDPTQEGPWDLHIIETTPARTPRCCGDGDQLERR